MSKFVRTISIEDGCERLVALNSIRRVHRNDNPERAAVVEDYNGHLFECTHDIMAAPRIEDCIVEV